MKNLGHISLHPYIPTTHRLHLTCPHSPQISLLFRIFFKLGTPTADIWRDLPGLAHFSGREFPKFPPKPMQEVRDV